MDTGYSATATGETGGSTAASETEGYLSLGKLKKQYLDYLSVKRAEIDEQKEARRYRHGSHYTQEQIEIFKKRKQPAVVYNEISRKINGTVGTIERERHDPKAFPRTPKHEEGAELATAVIRYALDQGEWKAKSPIVGADGATEGVGGIEIIIEKGDQGDAEVDFDIVDPDGFFYDSRSSRLDFSDARYMGVGKWMDIDQAKELFPDKADDLEDLQNGSELSTNSDKDQKWYSSENGRIRVVDHWYLHKGDWCYCIYTGAMKLMEGKSYLIDEKKKTYCKYVMFSAYVDQDGDRYGMVRQFKSAQDEVNARGSKGLHELNTRRIIAEAGAFDDIEKTRREAARPDGMVIRNRGFEAEFDDSAKLANIEGQLKFLERAQNRIDSYGPNLSLVGGETEKQLSGRATQLLMQAGMAELGPFLISYRGWKLRVYRGLFNAIKTHWTAERWIRVTDDEGLAQFIQLNGIQADPMTGQPTMVNAIGALDVDIILDEGPDSITIAQETYDTLGNVLSSVGPLLPPPQLSAAVQIMIDTSALPSASKKLFKEASKQQQGPPPPDPAVMAAQAKAEIDLQSQQAAAQLEAQRNQEANAAKVAAAQIDLEHKTKAAEIDLRAKEQQRQLELDLAHAQHGMELQHCDEMHMKDMEHEKMKATHATEHEVHKANIGLEAKHQESQLRQSEMKAKADTATKAEAEKSKPAQETSAAVAKAMTELTKALSKPKSISVTRDGSGRVSGATVRA